jgi:hypothetical protein
MTTPTRCAIYARKSTEQGQPPSIRSLRLYMKPEHRNMIAGATLRLRALGHPVSSSRPKALSRPGK